MSERDHERRTDGGLIGGLLTGALIGAAVAMALAPPRAGAARELLERGRSVINSAYDGLDPLPPSDL